MRVWIDASDARAGLRVFGMSLLERALRSILAAGLAPSRIQIELGGDEPLGRELVHEVSGRLPELPLCWSRSDAPPRERLAAAVAESGGEPLLAVPGDAVLDPRLLRHVAGTGGPAATQGGEGAGAAAIVRLEGPLPGGLHPEADLRDVARRGLETGALKELSPDELDAYVPKLRRHLPPYLFRVESAPDRDRAERFLFWSNYKGSTDLFTRHVYPPLVWRILRPLARRRVHPNWVSLFNVLITFAAVPLFAAGQWAPGLALAYAMSVLDSVDGKLARLTFRASRLGHVLDHGLDVIHPPFWYLAWAWALAGGDPGSWVFRAAVWMTACYVLDRLATQLFTWRTGRSIHAYTRLDVRMRTFISRRNINLPLFTLGLLTGTPVEALCLIVAWQVATFAFHAERVARYWNGRPSAQPGA